LFLTDFFAHRSAPQAFCDLWFFAIFSTD
jgi:hypothetical protein